MSSAAAAIREQEDRSKVEDLDFWSRRYLAEGHIWGDEPSKTAELLAEALDPVSRVLEVGFGYGRDIAELAEQGHLVTGIEKAIVGLDEARKQLRRYVDEGKAFLLLGDFTRASLPSNFDAVLSHRTLHLLGHNGAVRGFVNRAADVLKPRGLLYVSARDERDFNETQMKWVDQGVAEYKERPGHLVTFWNEALFREKFGKKFDDMRFVQGEEIESMKNQGVNAHFTIMIAKKKSDVQVPVPAGYTPT